MIVGAPVMYKIFAKYAECEITFLILIPPVYYGIHTRMLVCESPMYLMPDMT